MSHFLNFKIRIFHYLLIFVILLSGFLSSCGGTVIVPVKNPETTSLKIPELVSLEPADNASTVKRNAKIILTFNEPLDTLTLIVNTKDTQCSGTLQISSNDFINCVRMNPLELKDGNKQIVLSPRGVYAANEFHQLRVTTEIKSASGVSLKKEITTKPGFRTTWSQQMGTSGNDIGFAVSVDSAGNIYLAGLTSGGESGAEKDLFLAKYSPSGFRNWIQQAGFGRTVTAAVLRQKETGQLSLSAYAQEKESSAVILASYTLAGKKIFSKIIDLTGAAPGNGLTMDPEGHI